MGCVQSRIYRQNHPRLFHVWNVDSEGRPIKPGKIEVTSSQLILYQKENLVVRWPLTSLRRYGFDSEVFSFECGRRCTTGAGVYAFKCRRAEALFTILQESINNSGNGTNNGANTNNPPADLDQVGVVTHPVAERISNVHSSSLPNGTLHNNNGASSPTEDSSGYLEPITVNSHLHYPARSSSVSSRNIGTTSPGGYVCIHGSRSFEHPEGMTNEWPGLPSSPPRCCSLGTCGGRSTNVLSSTHHYVNNAIFDQNQCPNSMCIVNQYVNSSVVASSEMSNRCCSPSRCCLEQNENTYVNSDIATKPFSENCCAVNCSNCVDFNTNYAKLDDLLKQEQSVKRHKEQHYYVNVKPEQGNTGSSASSNCVSGRSSPTAVLNKNGNLTTPASPDTSKTLESHCYANVTSPTTSEIPQLFKERTQVNYAVLDLDQNEASAASNAVVSPMSTQTSIHSLSNSPTKSPEGYAQIDFDKTVALSISANPVPAFNDDSMRKTRHNAVIPCVSLSA